MTISEPQKPPTARRSGLLHREKSPGQISATRLLAKYVGHQVAKRCGQYLDPDGLAMLASTFASMSDDERGRQVAEVTTWAAGLREVEA